MNIEQLCDLAERYGHSVITKQEFVAAVEKYSSALIAAKPLVSGRSEQCDHDWMPDYSSQYPFTSLCRLCGKKAE